MLGPLDPVRRIAILTYPDGQSLDVSGPNEVFHAAGEIARAAGHPESPYRVEIIGRDAGPIRMSSGLAIVADRSITDPAPPIHTLIVAGGVGVRETIREGVLSRWLGELRGVRRLASVCTGAFLLAEAGLLDGRRATTHWASCDLLADRYPRVHVDPDPIFVRDGDVYTSAGVTAGMDLALALVEEDLGREIALSVARWLVLFLKRPGGQSQFSAQLEAQQSQNGTLRDLQGWICDHPSRDLSVATLARRVAMSSRNFARVFTRDVGITPARYVERVRIEAARRQLEGSEASVEQVAHACGFGTAETMRRAFLRQLRVNPADYRNRFRNTIVPADTRTPAPTNLQTDKETA